MSLYWWNFFNFYFKIYKVFEWLAPVHGLWCKLSLAQHNSKFILLKGKISCSRYFIQGFQSVNVDKQKSMLEKTGCWGCQENTCSLKMTKSQAQSMFWCMCSNHSPRKKNPNKTLMERIVTVLEDKITFEVFIGWLWNECDLFISYVFS